MAAGPSPSLSLPAVAAHLAVARTQREARERILDHLAEVLPHEAAAIHAMSPRVPLETGVFRGLEVAAFASSLPRWDELAVELAPLREHAFRHRGVAADHEVLTPAARGYRLWRESVLVPQKLKTLALVHFVVGGVARAVLGVGRRKADRFTEAELELLRDLAPTYALADLALGGLEKAAGANMPVRLVCQDQRLTARQREIVEHVALGHTNAEIAEALSLSPNTLRNHLATIFAKLGASNRAEVVRLAVLLPPAAPVSG
ncbi:MAG: helix-turn-helix transcriptional regulator [Sandaracinus sp.]